MFVLVEDHFYFVALDLIFLLLLLATLIVEALLSDVKIFVDILRSELSECTLDLPKAGFAGVDGPEDGEVDVLFVPNQLLLGGDELFQVLEVGSEDILQEVVPVEERDVAVVPQQLQSG